MKGQLDGFYARLTYGHETRVKRACHPSPQAQASRPKEEPLALNSDSALNSSNDIDHWQRDAQQSAVRGQPNTTSNDGAARARTPMVIARRRPWKRPFPPTTPNAALRQGAKVTVPSAEGYRPPEA